VEGVVVVVVVVGVVVVGVVVVSLGVRDINEGSSADNPAGDKIEVVDSIIDLSLSMERCVLGGSVVGNDDDDDHDDDDHDDII
jgi:hypothetical protein